MAPMSRRLNSAIGYSTADRNVCTQLNNLNLFKYYHLEFISGLSHFDNDKFMPIQDYELNHINSLKIIWKLYFVVVF